MKTNLRSGQSAFTLLELMAVIAIAVILASLLVKGMAYASGKQAKENARLQLAQLARGVEEYKNDMSTYPVSSNSSDGLGQSAKCLYQALFYEGYEYARQSPPAGTWTKATSIYVPDLDPTTSKQGWVAAMAGTDAIPPASTMVMDPWGKEYRYRSAKNAVGGANGHTVNPEFDLWSSGTDANSEPGTPSSPYNNDDLRNFGPPPRPVFSQPIAELFTGKPMSAR